MFDMRRREFIARFSAARQRRGRLRRGSECMFFLNQSCKGPLRIFPALLSRVRRSGAVLPLGRWSSRTCLGRAFGFMAVG